MTCSKLLTVVANINGQMRDAIYTGSILVIRNVPSLRKLCVHAESTVIGKYRANFDEFAHHRDKSGKSNFIRDLCVEYEEDPIVVDLFRSSLCEVGIVENETLWDRVRLRIQPERQEYFEDGSGQSAMDDITNTQMHGAGRFSQSLPIHRDTWANNLMCQINVWSPLAPLDQDRTLKIFPKFFNIPVPNDSKQWNYRELIKKRKQGEEYAQMPILVTEFENIAGENDEKVRENTELVKALDADACPVVVDPGDLILFSGAHLHGSVPNAHVGKYGARFSTEVRIYDVNDWEEGKGAVNCDGDTEENSKLTLKWFKRM